MGLNETTTLIFALVRNPIQQIVDDCMFVQKQCRHFNHVMKAIDDWHKSFQVDVHC